MDSDGLTEEYHDPDFGSNDASNGISSSGVITMILGLFIIIVIFIPLRKYYKSAKRSPGASPVRCQDGDTNTDIVLTEKDDFHDIYDATNTLKVKYHQFGIHLGLPPHELETIQKQFPYDFAQAFTQVLLLWLRKNYNVEKYGPPTWQALVKAVEHENRALGNRIAAKYLRTGPGDADKLVADVKQEIQLQQKSENLVTEATDMKHEANNEQKCENLAPIALDMSHESHDQHDEIKVKTLSQLQKDESEKQERIDNMFMNLRSAETVGICFVVDHTVSTGPWINRIKDIRSWREQLRANHNHLELHLAFVLYTDYDQPPYTRISTLDFTTDLDKFYHFVDDLVLPAGTRQDRAEDVFGGLDTVLSCSWQKVGTKVLIHLADSPCHGLQYHDPLVKDDYPEGDPEGLQLDDLMKRLADKQIAYHFGCINKSHTLAMIEAFNSSLLEQSNQQLSIQLFSASQESESDLVETIFHSVTTSIGATLERLLFGSDRYLHEYTIDEDIPHWDSLPVQQVVVMPAPTPGSLGTLEHPKTPMSVKIAPQPFALGAQRIAYHALDVDQNRHLVIKRSKWADERSSCLKRCLETANVHAIAALLFIKFKEEIHDVLTQNNAINVDVEQVTLGTVGVMQWIANEQEHNFTFEAYVGGSNYTKFNSSFACIPESRDYELNIICQAFSHYTWITSGKQLLVCDLQGKRDGSEVILTDPVIHDSVSVLHHGATNLGEKGIHRFFQLHKCNDICRAMQLEHQP